jgi:hypothetical protein
MYLIIILILYKFNIILKIKLKNQIILKNIRKIIKNNIKNKKNKK